MATNSFLFKGWAITVAATLAGFGVVRNKGALLVIAVLTTLAFWALDGYYLWLERGFIELHEQVAQKEEYEIDFSMAVDKNDAVRRWLRTCARPHLLALYGLITAVDGGGAIWIRAT
jgi:hypothetical protein